jgi:hypothetical protein
MVRQSQANVLVMSSCRIAVGYASRASQAIDSIADGVANLHMPSDEMTLLQEYWME